MKINLSVVREHVELYFKNHLPQYTVLDIRRKSCHPDDDYLWMVSAKKADNSFAVWTSWNETTQSLNFGHYNLSTIEECERVFEEFYFNG